MLVSVGDDTKKNKKGITIVVLIILLVAVTIGYSAISTSLNISGISSISVPKWDVHFVNVNVNTGSVSTPNPPSIASDNLTINYSVPLIAPGDYYEFTVDVLNDGMIDAQLSALPTLSGVSEEQDVYTNYTLTYADGTSLAVGDVITAGSSKKLKVRLEYDGTVRSSLLPTEAQTLNLSALLNYVQAD